MRTKIVSALALCVLACGCYNPLGLDTLRVTGCTPSNGVRGVQDDVQVVVTFNNEVSRKDIEDSFSLSGDEESVEGSFNWTSSKSFSFVPRSALSTNGRYVISIPRSVRDSKGNKMQMDFLSEFYAGADMDLPLIVSTAPAYTEGGTMNIPVDQDLEIVFSEPMDVQKTEEAFSLSPHTYGYFSWNAGHTIMQYVLTGEMEYGTQYHLTLSGGACDAAGNELAEPCSIIFITGDDFTPPEVQGMYDAGTVPPPYWSTTAMNEGVSKETNIAVSFSEPMNRSVTEGAFSLQPSTSGVFTWNAGSTIMVFSPEEALTPGAAYVIKVDTSAQDRNGRRLLAEHRALVHINGTDSRHFRVGNVYGSHDGGVTDAYHLLFFQNPATWPVSIEMGTVAVPATPTDSEMDYYFRIHFEYEDNGDPAPITTASIFDSVSVDDFGITYVPNIKDIIHMPGDSEIIVVIGNMSNDESSGAPRVLYRLTVSGGSYGMKDAGGNEMRESFSFECRED